MNGPMLAARIDLATLVRCRGPLDPRLAASVCQAVLGTLSGIPRPSARLRAEHLALSPDGATYLPPDEGVEKSDAPEARLVRDLGSLLHLMLHGRLPWDADSFDATASANVAQGLAVHADVSSVVSSTVPASLQALCDWSLAETSPSHTLAEFSRRLHDSGCVEPGPLRLDLQGVHGAPERLGHVVGGRYRLERVIGQGALGTVYEAAVVAVPNPYGATSVAVKVIDDRGGLPSERRARQDRRIGRELRSFARIQHPNVVTTLDVGFDDALDAHFLVMELLHGSDLATTLTRSGPLNPPVAIDLFVQAARGLAAAHVAGLVHRDVKPANLFLHQKPGAKTPTVKVCDFGLARVLEGDDTTAATRSGMLLGSPAYMSPEQLRDPREADARSDVWSLGVTLYQMLSGELPWKASGPGPLLAAIAQRRIRRLSEVAPLVPPALAAVVDRAMAGPREERYRSMLELEAALVQLREAPTQRNRRRAIVAGVAVTAVALTLTFLFGSGSGSTQRARPDTTASTAQSTKTGTSRGDRCSLAPESLAFSVKGLSVGQVKARAEAVGYVCAEWIEWWPFGWDGTSALVFENPAKPECGFTLFLGGRETVLPMAGDGGAGTNTPQFRVSVNDGAAFLLSTPVGCSHRPPDSLLASP